MGAWFSGTVEFKNPILEWKFKNYGWINEFKNPNLD